MKKYEYFKINNEANIDYILATSSEDMYFYMMRFMINYLKKKASALKLLWI